MQCNVSKHCECGEVFKTKSVLYNHFAQKHRYVTVEITSVKEESIDKGKEIEQEQYEDFDFDDYYKMESNPKEVDDEEKILEYKSSKEKIEQIMSKPKGKYTFEGREITVKIVQKIKGGKIALDVTGLNGKVGSLALKCYSTKNKNTMKLTKVKGTSAKFVRFAAQSISWPLLNGLISGELDNTSIREMENKSQNKTIQRPLKKNNCLQCGKTFKTGAWLIEHMGASHKLECEDCQFIFKTESS